MASHGVPERLFEEPEVEVGRGPVAVAHVQVLVHQVVIPELAKYLGERGDAAEVVAPLEEGDGLGVELRHRAFFEVRIGRERLVAQADDHQPGAGLALLLLLALDVLERFGLVVVVGVVVVGVVVGVGVVVPLRLFLARRVGLVVLIILDGPLGAALDVVHVLEILALLPGIPGSIVRFVVVVVRFVAVLGHGEPVPVAASRPSRRLDATSRGSHELLELERRDALERLARLGGNVPGSIVPIAGLTSVRVDGHGAYRSSGGVLSSRRVGEVGVPRQENARSRFDSFAFRESFNCSNCLPGAKSSLFHNGSR